jgi:aminoglycoside phosphotransferase (APT) family kinase protein
MARLHLVDPQRASFLEHHERGTTGLEQALTFWRSYYELAAEGREHRVMEEAGDWLCGNLPTDRPTSLAWGDARIGNMIFRDFTCVAVLDWDMVSLAGGESDLAWWILQDQGSAARLPGIGSLDETIGLWEQVTGRRAHDLHYYLTFNAFRLGAIRIRLAHQMAAISGPSPELIELETNNVAIQQLALLLGITPAGPVTATLPDLCR